MADKLAKLAKYSHSKVWYDDIPHDVKREREREREREDIFERRVWGWKCDNDINIWVWNFGLVDRLLGVLLLNLFIY